MPPVSPAHQGLGAAVKEIRSACAFTQADLGRLTGLDRTYIGGVERGERNASYGSLLKIADALGVSVSELIALGERLTT